MFLLSLKQMFVSGLLLVRCQVWFAPEVPRNILSKSR